MLIWYLYLKHNVVINCRIITFIRVFIYLIFLEDFLVLKALCILLHFFIGASFLLSCWSFYYIALLQNVVIVKIGTWFATSLVFADLVFYV